MNLDNSTYFVEECYINENESLELTLFDVEKFYHEFDEGRFRYEVPSDIESTIHLWKRITLLRNPFFSAPQSRFLKYRNGEITSANNGILAKRYRFIDWTTRSRFYNNNSPKELPPLTEKCTSYHVNVGHGNCTFITDGKTSIGVDCSAIDFRNNQSYHSNISDCIAQIKNDFELSEFKLDYFVLTHPHYDHYSGIHFLCNINVINNNTTVFFNQYYSHPNPLKISAIQRLCSTAGSIIEPIRSNSIPGMDIIYPQIRCYKNGSTVNRPFIRQKDPNNSSTVIKISSQTKSMLITGDIEKDGWKYIDICKDIQSIDYYIHSHHGSHNGYTIHSCSSHPQATDISTCISGCSQTLILGRTGAFSNMPCNALTTAFPTVLYSEKDANGNQKKFLKLKWDSNSPTWF